jgi:REP element-mobilizing transposase RayT
MPRRARIDAPGAVHHIIARGIERRKIFYDDQDRETFIQRLAELVAETRTQCFAWALIPNHFHLLLKTGNVPIATIMRRLLTGYAVGFNRRHSRNGHVFQNRYKSILCDQDAYLKELVRYIHLNPLRAKLVQDIKGLDRYRYAGHSCLMGKCLNHWQEVDEVLALFSSQVPLARRRYREFFKAAIHQGRRDDLVGGGLVRSAGGWSAVAKMRKAGHFLKSDERILGGSDFVTDVLASAQEALDRQCALTAKGIGFDQVVAVVSDLLSIQAKTIVGPSKERIIVKARVLVCYWAVTECGLSMTEVATRLNISVPTVSVAVKRGREMVSKEGLVFADLSNIKI